MTINEKLNNASNACLIIMFSGLIIKYHTNWAAAEYIQLAGFGLWFILMVYRLLHWKTFRNENIVFLLLLGMAAFVLLCIFIGLAVQ